MSEIEKYETSHESTIHKMSPLETAGCILLIGGGVLLASLFAKPIIRFLRIKIMPQEEDALSKLSEEVTKVTKRSPILNFKKEKPKSIFII